MMPPPRATRCYARTVDGDDDETRQRLLALFQKREGASIPRTTFARLRKTATSAARAAAATARQRITGRALDEETIEKIILSLGELKGLSMKLGQILSYVDAPLPENLRRQLAVLQVQSPATPFSDIERTLRADLGERADELLAHIGRVPASSASIGQVHRARLEDGTRVAVKVVHPGVEEALRADFRGAHVAKRFVQLLVPGADVSDVIAEAEATLLDECDYEREAKNQQRFREIYATDPDVIVPVVYAERSSRRVLTTEWCDGKTFDAFLKTAAAEAIDRAGKALFRFYVETFYAHGFFNADPHPGNLLFHDDGRVVFLDYGCLRAFNQRVVEAMAALSAAVRAEDETQIVAALSALGAKLDDVENRRAGVTLSRAFFAPLLAPGKRKIEVGFASTLKELVEHKRALLRLHLPGELLFLMRIRFGAYSVLAKMGAEADWRSLEATAAELALH
jgi:predicted unusual protein kinase regulating ubiquinone biosynthesis (AarF/ABC1/UbiB family)